MKMTREQVADLLLRMNEDLSNVELFDGGWRLSNKVLGDILFNISNGIVYRIKDNAVKEVTPALRGKWINHKETKVEYPITGLNFKKQTIYICERWFNVKEFNAEWQLVED